MDRMDRIRDRDRSHREHDRERRSDHERDRDRDRERRHDRSSSRDDRRDRDRDRDRTERSYDRRDRERSYEDRDRSPDHRERYSRHSAGSQDFYEEPDLDGPKYEDDWSDRRSRLSFGGRGRWYDSVPNNIILVRGLPEEATENDVVSELLKTGTVVKDVRLMRNKDNGISLRYCFVEFHTIPEAQQFMEMKQGHMMFWDKVSVALYYSTSKRGAVHTPTGGSSSGLSAEVPGGGGGSGINIDPAAADWTCVKCSCKNFQRRVYCRRCSHSRIESERVTGGDGLDQVGSNPCNTIILRGLDGLTTEDNIIAAFANLTAIPLKNVRVIRDRLTGVSSGYAFVELPSLKDSQELVDSLEKMSTPVEVDGKALLVNYAKNTFTTAITTLEQGHTNAHAAVDYNQHSYYDYNSYYYPQASAADSTNAAEVAQAAIIQSQQKKQKHVGAAVIAQPAVLSAGPVIHKPGQTSSVVATSATATIPMGANEFGQFPVPDVSTYQYDESSGYYYDPLTGLYYDSNSTYYYNTQTQQFLYWDSERRVYLPPPTTQDSASGQTQAGALADQQKKEEEKRPPSPEKKVKIAKRIVKDMEKWAKKLNAQKEQIKDETKPIAVPQPIIDPVYVPTTASATADAGFSLLEKTVYNRYSADSAAAARPPKESTTSAAASSAASLFTKADSPPLLSSTSEDTSSSGAAASGALSVEELIDWNKLACLLCRRAFPSKEILLKHQQMSDLHKKNVEDLLKAKGGGLSQDGSTLQYRDRAKERREKYGQPEPPLPKRRRAAEVEAEPIPFEQPTRDGIKDDNIGNRLLQKMGWNAGQGLGRAKQGIVDPIEARQRQQQAGLGARGSSFNVEPTGTYKERARKTFYQYFQEIN